MAISANKTKFYYSNEEDFNEIKLLMEVPEMGGSVEKIDVTTLSDPSKRYIPGIKDYGDLVFKFLYENEDEDSNYRVLKNMEDEAAEDSDFKPAKFLLVYPDKSAHAFDAIPSIKIDSGAINGALTFSATMMLQSDIESTDPEEFGRYTFKDEETEV